jgi:hypothetical protein
MTHEDMIIDSLFKKGGTLACLPQVQLVQTTSVNGIIKNTQTKNAFLKESICKHKTGTSDKGQTIYSIVTDTYEIESNLPYSDNEIISNDTFTDYLGNIHVKTTFIRL